MIDTHAHLDAADYLPDFNAMLERARQAGVTKILLPSLDEKNIERLWNVASRHPGQLYPMVGLHPTHVTPNYREQLDRLYPYLETAEPVAVGETGIDLYHSRTLQKEQTHAFEQQLDWALRKQLPVVIHSRDSIDEIIAVLRKRQHNPTGVFHCFTGDQQQMAQVLAMGFHIGIGGVVTFKNSGLDAVVKQCPRERLLLETDAPYLSPVPFRGKRNEPAYLTYIVAEIARRRETTPEQIIHQTTQNAEKLFFNME